MKGFGYQPCPTDPDLDKLKRQLEKIEQDRADLAVRLLNQQEKERLRRLIRQAGCEPCA